MGEAVAEALLTSTPSKLHKGKGSSLTYEQLEALVVLARLNKTQTEIGEAISCNQATVSRYLKALTPTGEYAGALLRAKQGELAEKLLDKAKGSDIIDLLERFEAIPAKKDSGKGMLTVQIGVNANDVTINLSPGETVAVERRSAESLAIEAGSDKASSVNQR